MSISHQEARRILDAAIAKADELGVKVGISVVDDHADLVASIVMGDAGFLFLPQASMGKAMATVVWRGQLSGVLNERAGAPMFQAVNAMYNNKLVYQQGAVPLKRGDELIGAVGAGGASPQQDEEIAAAGAAALEG